MVFMTLNKTLKIAQLMLITLSLSVPVYAGDSGGGGGGDWDTGGGGGTTVPDYSYPDDGGGSGDGGNSGGNDGGGDIYVDHTGPEIRYVVADCNNTCSSGTGAHRHYGGCGHSGSGRGDDYWDNGRDGGRESWRERVECSTRYPACSQILCESNYSEFRSCERYEEEYERSGRGRRGGSGDGDCYECSINSESSYAENVSAWMNPLAYIATGLGSAYLGYRGQKAWADSYASGHQQCTSRFNSYLDYNITRGSNPILPEQAEGLLDQCNGSQMGGLYAGYGGMQGGGFGGGFGNPYASAGFSPGFLGGMSGPYGGQFPGGMYPGMGGAGGGISGGFQIGIGGNLGLGGGMGGGQYGGMYPGMGAGGMYGGGGMYPGGVLHGGAGIYAGGAGMGNPGGFYTGANGGFYPGGWNGQGGGYWNNSGGQQGQQFWQQQQQQMQSANQYSNHVNQGNYMTGQVAGNALGNNYMQAQTSMYNGMGGPAGFYGSTPYQQGGGLSGGFSYGLNYGFGY